VVTRGDRVSRPWCWHDGGVFERPRSHRSRRLAVILAAVAGALTFGVLAAGCSRDEAATPATLDQRAAAETLSTNPFIPEDVNIGDCVSSLPRPGCGNEIRGDGHSMLTFAVLVAGLSFIGWRIGRSVRRRDAPRPDARRPDAPTGTPPPT
jgi:hypothetical protein